MEATTPFRNRTQARAGGLHGFQSSSYASPSPSGPGASRRVFLSPSDAPFVSPSPRNGAGDGGSSAAAQALTLSHVSGAVRKKFGGSVDVESASSYLSQLHMTGRSLQRVAPLAADSAADAPAAAPTRALQYLQSCAKLTHAYFDHNALRDVTGLSSLRALTTVSLRANQLTAGAAPELGRLPALRALQLGGNGIRVVAGFEQQRQQPECQQQLGARSSGGFGSSFGGSGGYGAPPPGLTELNLANQARGLYAEQYPAGFATDLGAEAGGPTAHARALTAAPPSLTLQPSLASGSPLAPFASGALAAAAIAAAAAEAGPGGAEASTTVEYVEDPLGLVGGPYVLRSGAPSVVFSARTVAALAPTLTVLDLSHNGLDSLAAMGDYDAAAEPAYPGTGAGCGRDGGRDDGGGGGADEGEDGSDGGDGGRAPRGGQLGHIWDFHNLRELNLSGNALSDLGEIVQLCRGCPRLRSLNLTGNPVAKLRKCREMCILLCPDLAYLDDKPLLEHERAFYVAQRRHKHAQAEASAAAAETADTVRRHNRAFSAAMAAATGPDPAAEVAFAARAPAYPLDRAGHAVDLYPRGGLIGNAGFGEHTGGTGPAAGDHRSRGLRAVGVATAAAGAPAAAALPGPGGAPGAAYGRRSRQNSATNRGKQQPAQQQQGPLVLGGTLGSRMAPGTGGDGDAAPAGDVSGDGAGAGPPVRLPYTPQQVRPGPVIHAARPPPSQQQQQGAGGHYGGYGEYGAGTRGSAGAGGYAFFNRGGGGGGGGAAGYGDSTAAAPAWASASGSSPSQQQHQQQQLGGGIASLPAAAPGAGPATSGGRAVFGSAVTRPAHPLPAGRVRIGRGNASTADMVAAMTGDAAPLHQHQQQGPPQAQRAPAAVQLRF